ncbi:MAG: hypothetical protein ACHRXM_09325 [Isosphaerales bacterium]
MTGNEEILGRWKALAGDTSEKPWDPDNLGGFFQQFRPLGEGLEAAFEGVVGADEILPRLLEVYPVTADGWRSDEAYDAYFIVHNPRPISASRAKDLIGLYLESVAAMAQAVGNDDSRGLLERPLRVGVVEGEKPWPPGRDDPETMISETTGDFMRSLLGFGGQTASHLPASHYRVEANHDIRRATGQPQADLVVVNASQGQAAIGQGRATGQALILFRPGPDRRLWWRRFGWPV